MTTAAQIDASSPPLAGIRVLELGHYVAAPFATRLLADLGAEIIKVEPPGGDPIRKWGAAYKGSTLWWSVHARNKRCVSLNLKNPQARDVVLDLVRHCDAAPGASGNTATEDAVWMFERMGVETGVDMTALLQLARRAARLPGGSPGGRVRTALAAAALAQCP